MKKKFEWKQNSRVKLPAKVVGKELERLEKKYGKLTKEIVVKEAKQKTNPLHNEFEWDDKKAAYEHRLSQARYIIRSLTVTIIEAEDQEPVRAFVSIVPEGEKKPQYASTINVMSQEEYIKQVLDRAKQELKDWADRYKHLKEFAELIILIKKI